MAPRRLSRTVAAASLAVVALAACGRVGEVAGDIASDIASEADQLRGGGDGGTTDTGGDGGDAADSGGDTSGSDAAAGATDGGAAPGASVDDFGGVGANGRAMLRGSVANLVIEVDVQDGAPGPSQAALDHLASTLRAVVDKPGGVSFAGGNSFPSDRTEWTSADLRAVAKANRSAYSNADTVAVYIAYVRGSFHSGGDATNAIGVAYNASEVGIFSEKWQDFGALLGSTTAVERAVLVHELGHLFGLVNLTYTSDIAHEDAEHRGHSNDKRSAMYWAIETTLVQQLFSGPPPDSFADADLADLAGLKEGRY